MVKKDLASQAATIIDNLGGNENLTQINHCATRLRVMVKDPEKVNVSGLKKLQGVLGVEQSDNNIQVIVGQTVEDLYNEVEKLVSSSIESNTPVKHKNSCRLFQFISSYDGWNHESLNSSAGYGRLHVHITDYTADDWYSFKNSSTYIILNNFGQSVFYFLPVFVAYTSAKKFDTDPVLAIFLASALLYPGWVSMASKGALHHTLEFLSC